MKSIFGKVAFLILGLSAACVFAEGLDPNYGKVNSFPIEAVGIDQYLAVANQKCQVRAQELWYQAGAQCAQAGGQLVNSLSVLCQPTRGPSFNWESIGRGTVYCSVPAFYPPGIPYSYSVPATN